MQTSIKIAIDRYENNIGCRIKPDRLFYNKIGINQKRFGQLLRGEKEPLISEAKSLAKFLGTSIDELCNNIKPGHYSK
ncbi:helix-turn-helix transcriptional regulator [Dyadobacter sp. NIV53]|uniref:helix-turn-helix domain-containing protein n=1 Tax=Dyadobacter sp. NIV53 TaxID=2861765 RepID=UPI001C871D1B|nr:helix-turn-helix transcriptional regulator [Dyadobacter sp. NIV53]